MKRGRPPKGAKVVRTCEQCGTTWEAYPWELDRLKYCSRECWGKSRVGKPALCTVEPETRLCAHCKKPYLVGGAGRPRRRSLYCSRSCAKHGTWMGKGAHNPAKEMSQLERVWFAGILDGEGCIGWPRRTILHSVCLTVINTHKGLIDRIAEVTGTGRIKPAQRSKNLRHSAAWTWTCYGDNARSLLRQALPWLIIKKEAADVALGNTNATEPPWTQRSRTMRAAQ